MDDKTKKKINGLIDNIYWIYIMTGLMHVAEMLKGAEPKSFTDYLIYAVLVVGETILWLPLKLSELL